MNSITAINTPSVLTMSSREIAELTKKRHPDVTRDIETMFDHLGIDASSFAHIYLDSMNRQQTEYRLPKRETTILVSGYSVVLRARIKDRWMELEEQAKGTSITLPDFDNPAIAARAWAEQYEQRLAAEDRAKELEGPAQVGGHPQQEAPCCVRSVTPRQGDYHPLKQTEIATLIGRLSGTLK